MTCLSLSDRSGVQSVVTETLREGLGTRLNLLTTGTKVPGHGGVGTLKGLHRHARRVDPTLEVPLSLGRMSQTVTPGS